jgi:nitrite reductase (NO-forming)
MRDRCHTIARPPRDACRQPFWFDGRMTNDPAATPPPAVQQLLSLGAAPGRSVVDRGPERRVVLAGMVGAGAFLAAAAVVFVTGIGGGTAWLPLHLALAGGAGLAIAALLPHFTVSLAGARPAPARIRAAGLGLTAAGAIAVAAAFPANAAGGALLGAVAYITGMGVSAYTAFVPARAGLGRRFGVVEAAYGLALANGVLAVAVAMLRLGEVATLEGAGAWLSLKPAHAWLNLVGFASLVIAGTLIHLYPTVVGSRIRPRRALLGVVAGVGLGAPVAALGYALGSGPVAVAGALTVAAGAACLVTVALGGWSGRGRWTTDPAWHLLTIGHLSAAIAWFAVGAVILVTGVVAHGAGPAGWSLPRVIGPLVIGWALQALVGAWSHLAPSVGPGDVPRHAAQRRELGRWAAPRLAAWNAGALLVTGGSYGPDWMEPTGLALVGATLLASLALLGRALVVRAAEARPA